MLCKFFFFLPCLPLISMLVARKRESERGRKIYGDGVCVYVCVYCVVELTGENPSPPLGSNGGRDVFVDIGDKSWGVTVCQKYFEKQARDSGSSRLEIRPENTLHVGDQFLSAGANDFRARRVGTTAWIASPEETVELLDELADLMGKKMA